MSVAAEQPVTVETATVTTEVAGRVALTTFDLTFRNPNARQLEGTFEFPLLAGQTVVRFALDISGQLREAVPIEKDRGRVIFEEIERRRVDPGLLEQTAGNNYRARVFPIPARGTRRVVIAYQEDIRRADAAAYRLPLNFKHPVKTFRLEFNVLTGAREPAKVKTTLPLTLPAWENARRLVVTRQDFQAEGVIELELPPTTTPAVITGQRAGSHYFVAEMPVATRPAARERPRVVGLLWDASASGAARDHAREFAFLDAWFAAVPDVAVRLVVVRHVATAPVTVEVRGGDWKALRERLDGLVYDGATGLDGFVPGADVDEWLWFTDGLLNFGRVRDVTFARPVQAVVSNAAADHARLRRLTESTGGGVLDLLQSTPFAAAEAARAQRPRVLRVERNPEQVAELFPLIGTAVSDQRVIVTGRLLGRAATVRLEVGTSGGPVESITLQVEQGRMVSDLAPRAWAAGKINALAGERTDRRSDIRRTAQQFGIVTADTSLLVLETVNDYARYDVEPPPELRDGWERLRRANRARPTKERRSHLDAVAAQYQDRIAWWKRAFPKGARPEEPHQDPAPFNSSTVPIPPLPGQRVEPTFSAAPAPAPAQPGVIEDLGEEIVTLSPFEVSAAADVGYTASTTLAGSRVTSGARASFRAPGAGHDAPTTEAMRPATTVTLKRWNANAAYLERLEVARAEERQAVYLEERATQSQQPGFFLDVSDWLIRHEERTLGLQVLSNLAELQLENPPLLRVLAQRLLELGEPALALPILEEVLRLRPEEPQSLRDLAHACAALKDYQRAVDLLWQLAEKSWDERFRNIEGLALTEMNALIATCGQTLDLSRIDSRLLKPLPVGLRVVLTWDADATDIDLWVDDPNGEQASYKNALTYQGGRMSSDFTRGYGPEEFMLRDPKPGKYVVKLHYFGDDRQTALGPITAQARVITGYGTAEQKEQVMTVRLAKSDDSLEIGTIEVPGPAGAN